MSIFNNTVLRDVFAFNYPPSTDLAAKVRSIPILGKNDDIDSASVPETMWEVGGAYVFPTAASVATMTSTSDHDKFGGIGAGIILVEGLDSNYNEQFETVIMNGSGVVSTTKSFYRINAFRSVYHGAAKVAAGTITCTVDGKTVRQISASIDYTAVYTVPKDHSLFTMHFTHNLLRTATAIITLETKVYVPDTNGIVAASYIVVSNAVPTNVQPVPQAFPKIPEKSDYWIDVSYSSANNVPASTIGRALLVKNSIIPTY